MQFELDRLLSLSLSHKAVLKKSQSYLVLLYRQSCETPEVEEAAMQAAFRTVNERFLFSPYLWEAPSLRNRDSEKIEFVLYFGFSITNQKSGGQ